jgi:hypothetical protein
MRILTRKLFLEPKHTVSVLDGVRSLTHLMHTMFTRQRWLLLEQHNNAADGLSALSGKLRNLGVPITVMMAISLRYGCVR